MPHSATPLTLPGRHTRAFLQIFPRGSVQISPHLLSSQELCTNRMSTSPPTYVFASPLKHLTHSVFPSRPIAKSYLFSSSFVVLFIFLNRRGQHHAVGRSCWCFAHPFCSDVAGFRPQFVFRPCLVAPLPRCICYSPSTRACIGGEACSSGVFFWILLRGELGFQNRSMDSWLSLFLFFFPLFFTSSKWWVDTFASQGPVLDRPESYVSEDDADECNPKCSHAERVGLRRTVAVWRRPSLVL